MPRLARGFRERELLEEDLGHAWVETLADVNQDLPDSVSGSEWLATFLPP